MSDKINKGRRSALGKMIGGVAAIPLVGLTGVAVAADNKLDESSAAAVGLKYKHDATQASRADKGGTKGADQTCENCQFLQGDSGEWLPCVLFPGKTVAAKGWCSAWAKKA